MTKKSALSTQHSVLSPQSSVLLLAITSLVITTAGCPTPPTSVRGDAGEVAPGELIEWPARQVDPTGEDTAGFNQIISADMNGDGLVDLVTAAYESQPIQIHLQQRAPDGTISFRSFSVAGSGPIVRSSELRVADIDQDGNLDIVMSILDTGFTVSDLCASLQGRIIILFAPPDPADNLNWEEFNLTFNHVCSLLQVNDAVVVPCDADGDCPGGEICLVNRCVAPCVTDDDCNDGDPESINICSAGVCSSRAVVISKRQGFDGNERSYASLDVGDVNNDGFPDILAAFNGCDDETIPLKQVELWINPADDRIRTNEILLPGTTLTTTISGVPDGCAAEIDSPWQKILLQRDFVDISSARFSDVDLDGDLDVVALRPASKTFDLTWQANPLIPFGEDAIDLWGSDGLHPIGESDAGFDFVEIGDLDGDGFNDVLALGQSDRLLRWFRRPLDPVKQDFPWEVFNIVQYSTLVPTAMEIADVNVDGQLDIVAAAGGHIRWFTPLNDSPFESWSEQFVVSDSMLGDSSATVGSSPFFPINSVHAVDIDDDGRLDIVATFDREGTDNDLIVWFRNNEIEIE